MSFKFRWWVILALCVTHFAVFAVGRYLGKTPGILHRELPLEYAYLEANLGIMTGNPEVALVQVDKSLRVFSKPLYMWGVDKQRASMERSFLQALRSRVLVALHRDAEAKSAAEEASKFCVEAGRQSCDGARLVEYSKRLMKANWD